MKIVFSRKGFDSSYGGSPSPIVDGRPISLPIPGSRGETTTYEALGLDALVRRATRGRMSGTEPCHDDPMFAQGSCWLGQVNQAQAHLANQNVSQGDVFLFFGLFAEADSGERHHRIFGWMRVTCHGPPEVISRDPGWRAPPRPHPHFFGSWEKSNTIYHGAGGLARSAASALRLTRPGGPLNRWIVPPWLREAGLTYHARQHRWLDGNELDSARRGQEFVCHIGNASEPRRWLDSVLAEMDGQLPRRGIYPPG